MNVRLTLLFAATAAGLSAADTKPAATPARSSPTVERAATAAAPRNDSLIAPSAAPDAFRIITDRNIFNANRTGRRDRTTEEAPPRVDVITLVGTMDSDRGLRAFFDGSDAAYRKALHVDESIDKFKVTKIASNTIDLERDGKTFPVRVGQQFRRPDGGDWNLVAEEVARREAQTRAAADAKVDPNAPPVIPANVDDVTRRMMERRAQQLKQ